jgi:hypothetical protein
LAGYTASAIALRTVTTDGSMGARTKFLAAIDGIHDYPDGADRLCVACLLVLPIQRAGILIKSPGVGVEVLCASDDIARRIEWTQVTLGEGPAFDAIGRALPISAPDLTHMQRIWPIFSSEVADFVIGSMYALPLSIGAIKVGVLDLYCEAGKPLSAAQFADALAIAELITAILLNADSGRKFPASLGPWWNQPPSAREVHQATGMVMAQLDIDARAAYVRLQALAFAQNRLITDVASDVVHRRLRFSSDPDVDLAFE